MFYICPVKRKVDFMKVMSFQQPWASLITAGIKDVEKRSWEPEELPERILIHATPRSIIATKGSYPLEWMQIVKNEQIYGNLPYNYDLPINAIIGYVSLNWLEKKSVPRSFSLKNENEYYWHFKDAYLFDEPILEVRSKLYLWDYDIDENNLPAAHKVKCNRVAVKNYNVNIPVTENIFLGLAHYGEFAIEFSIHESLLCQPNSYKMKRFKYVTFKCKGEQRTFALEPETGLYEDNVGDDFYYSDPYDSETRIRIKFFWGKEL